MRKIHLLLLCILFLAIGLTIYKMYLSNPQILHNCGTQKPCEFNTSQNESFTNSSWKTYSSDEFGVSFEYPSDWTENIAPPYPYTQGQQYADIVIFHSDYTPQSIANISFYDNPKNLSLQDLDKEVIFHDDVGGTYSPNLSKVKEHLDIESEMTILYEDEYFCEPSICKRYLIPANGKVFQIVVFPVENKVENLDEGIRHILSTFKNK